MVTRIHGLCQFDLAYSGASRVHITGDFNRWSKTATPMQLIGPDHWRATLRLEPGTYRFQYYVPALDVHLADFAAFGLVVRPDGQWDSVLYVPEPAGGVPRPDHFPVAVPA